MAFYRKKPVIIEAITFDELVKHGVDTGCPIVSGMPWSFQYRGHPITHEDDNCYLIPTEEGIMRFERGDMLITGVKGEIYPCKKDIFEMTYEAVLEGKVHSQARCTECDGHGYVNGPPGPVGEPNGEPCPKCSTNVTRTEDSRHFCLTNKWCPRCERHLCDHGIEGSSGVVGTCCSCGGKLGI